MNEFLELIQDVDLEHVNDDMPMYGKGFDYANEKSNWCVYVHINKINGKKYIGISQNLADRWRRNGDRYSGCDAIYSAFKKYGYENFKHVLLIQGVTASMADIIEKELIKKYSTYAETRQGYNIAHGGLGGGIVDKSYPVYQYDLNGIYIQSFSNYHEAEIVVNDRDTGYIGKCLHGSHYAYGFLWTSTYVDSLGPFTEEQKKIFRNNITRLKDKETPIIRIPKDDFNDRKIFDNLSSVSCDGKYKGQVIKCCRSVRDGIFMSHDGYFWIFNNKDTQNYINFLLNYRKCKSSITGEEVYRKERFMKRSISCYSMSGDFVKTYCRYKDIINDGFDPSTVYKVCNGKISFHKDFQWRYSDDQEPGSFKRKKKENKKLWKKIAKIDKNTHEVLKIYDSLTSVNEDFPNKQSDSNLSSCAKGKYKTMYGYIWRYVDKDGNIIKPEDL